MNERNELVVVAEGRLDLRDEELHLNNKPLLNTLWEYADGNITICISKEREARRKEIIKQIFVDEEQPNDFSN